jgi:Na+-driven multidrug efflux pump
MLMIFTVGILPFFGLKRLLVLTGNSPQLIQKSLDMIFYAFPGMGIRLVSDCAKPFFQNQSEKLLNEFGKVYCLYFLLTAFPLTWLLVKVLDFRVGAFGAVIAVYELGGLFICIYFYLRKSKRETRDCSVSVTQDIGHSLKMTLMNFISEWPMYFIWDILNFIVAMTHDPLVLAAYSLMCNTSMSATTCSAGIIIQIRAVVNQVLGNGQPGLAKSMFKRFQWVGLMLSFLFVLVFGLLMYGQTYFHLYENIEMQKLMEKSNLLFVLRSTLTCVFYNLFSNGLRTIEQQKVLMMITFLTLPTSPLATYLSGVYFGYGINGICLVHLFLYNASTMMMRIYVLEYDWSKVNSFEIEKSEI